MYADIRLTTKKKYNWLKELGVHACNRDSRCFETTSSVYNLKVRLFGKSTSPNAVANDLAKNLLWNGDDYEYTLYDDNFKLRGYAWYE